MRHQRTDFPPSKNKKKGKSFKSRPQIHKRYSSDHNQHQVPSYKMKFDLQQAHKGKGRWSKCRDSKHIEGLKCPARKFHAKHLTSMDILQACATRSQCLLSSEHPRHISCKLSRCICEKISYVASQKIWPPVRNFSVSKWRYNTHKLIPRFPHHILLLPI